MDFQDELIHEFILVYFTKIRALLSTLMAFSLTVPELPMHFLAISGQIFVRNGQRLNWYPENVEPEGL